MSRRDSRDHTTIWLIPMVVLLVVGVRADLFVWGDTWYNLTLGREIASHGIMRVDTLSAVWLGLPVADAQWLAHLTFYAVARTLGVTAVPTLGLLLVAATVLTVVWAHLRRDTRPARPGIVLLTVALVLMGIGSQLVLRAQTLVYPIITGVLWVMHRRVAHASTAVATVPRHHAPWMLLPVIVLWANLHGSMLLAPLFAGAACVAIIVQGAGGMHRTSRRDVVEYAVFTVAAAACVLCTPYGVDLLSYYRDTVGSARFRGMITEWYPLWAAPEVGIVVMVSVVAVAVLRARGHWFARFVLAGLVLMAVMSVRHATPLALAALVLLPPLLEQMVPARWTFSFAEVPSRPVRVVCLLAAGWVLVGVPWRLRPALSASAIRTPLNVVHQLAAHPQACLFIDEQQAERFLWFAPELKGKVAHGVRVETLPTGYLQRVAQVYGQPGSEASHRYLARFDAVVLDVRLRERLVASLSADSTFVQVAHQHPVYVFRAKGDASAAPAAPAPAGVPAPAPTPCVEAREDAAREIQGRHRSDRTHQADPAPRAPASHARLARNSAARAIVGQ